MTEPTTLNRLQRFLAVLEFRLLRALLHAFHVHTLDSDLDRVIAVLTAPEEAES